MLPGDALRVTGLEQKWYAALAQDTRQGQCVTGLKEIIENRRVHVICFDEIERSGKFVSGTNHGGPSGFKNDLKIQRYDGIILDDEDASVLQRPIHRAIHQ